MYDKQSLNECCVDLGRFRDLFAHGFKLDSASQGRLNNPRGLYSEGLAAPFQGKAQLRFVISCQMFGKQVILFKSKVKINDPK